jgi:aspartyl-tRNA synthetase
MKRTHTCGELTEKYVGQAVTLCGWVKSRRDHGGLIFLDIEDRYGITQLVFNPQKNKELHQQAEQVKPQFTIAVSGQVAPRPDGTVNPDRATGQIEIEASGLEIFSASEPLPIDIESDNINPESRMKYRYLDLRRKPVKDVFILRHRVYQVIRNYFSGQGFIEIETPFLTKSTPEGARDYLVPSRISPGSFFALPQSPQLFKQLLMVGGLDRYFQIVRCMRDEDLRADRQPEFTQLDIEMSFIDEPDIMGLIEGAMAEVFRQALNIEIKTPFRRMPYDEAILRYGSDKPDLRFEMHLSDATAILAVSDFKVFQQVAKDGGIIKGLSAKGAFSRSEIDKLTELVKGLGASGLVAFSVQNNALAGAVAKYIKPDIQQALIKECRAQDGDYIFLIAGKPDIANQSLGNLRLHLAERLGLLKNPKERKERFCFCWVTEFPLLKYDEEARRYVSEHHPFTSPRPADMALLDSKPGAVKARAYDLVLNGVELGGGSIRIHSQELQKRIFSLLGIGPEEAQERFGFLLEAFRYGPPPHGGIALGMDRLIMLLAGTDNIRDVIAFPKTMSTTCLLTGAPSKVDEKQLKELGITITKPQVNTDPYRTSSHG